MQIILTKNCESLTGTLSVDLGYFIVKRKRKFYSVRSKHRVPPDGHWRFILTCAELAQSNLHIADIRVSGYELKTALTEACLFASASCVELDNVYSADDVLTFKQNRGL